MTKVLFCHGAEDRLQAAAAWLWQAAQRGTSPGATTIIYAPDGHLADRFDQLLWTAPATGFLPHCRVDSPLAAETQVLIARELDSLTQDQLLLNLSDELPPGFGRFANLVEIISQEDSVRLPGRERAKFYRDRGYDIQYRDLQKDPL